MLGGFNYLDLNLNKISKRVFIIENVKAQCDISNYNTGFTADQSLQALQISSTPIFTAA